MGRTSEDLLASIDRDFPTAHPPTERIAPCTHEDCDECAEIEHDFAGRTWNEITDEKLRYHSGSIHFLMSDPAWRYFLPAFLRSIVKTSGMADDAVADSTVAALSSKYMEEARASGLEPSQRRTIVQVLRWLDLRQDVGKVLAEWEERLSTTG